MPDKAAGDHTGDAAAEHPRDMRAEREARALRENLRRRKEQARQRSAERDSNAKPSE